MSESREARADPKKGFFIDVITMDIDYPDCILDLIDNSVDAFTRSGSGDGEIRVDFGDDYLEIYDNCGGIAENDLLEVVFRFGGHVASSGGSTLGIYGVGLKRAIFKIGNAFEFETYDGDNHNIVYEDDLSEWKRRDDDVASNWRFKVKRGRGLKPSTRGFSRLRITGLKDSYRKMVTLDGKISDEIAIKYVAFMSRGLDFRVNDVLVEPKFRFDMIDSDKYRSIKLIEVGGVTVKIVCGYNPREEQRVEPLEGRYGWNIFCNDRLILVSDTTKDTGWGMLGNLEFHQLYYPFCGYVFMNSDDVHMLPVKTTKNGLVVSDEIYKFILNEMWKQATPVLKHIRKSRLADEDALIQDAQRAAQEKVLEDAKEATKNLSQKSVFSMNVESSFNAPDTVPKGKDMVTIVYKRPTTKVKKVKKRLGVTSNKKAGEITFDLFYEDECDDV